MKIGQLTTVQTHLVKKTDVVNKLCTNVSQNESSQKQKVFSENILIKSPSFKGANLTQLIDNYKWFVNVDKTPPLKSFLKINAEKPVMENLFNTILQDDKLSHSFIWDLVKDPRTCEANYRSLKEVIGENTQSLLFFIPGNNYTKSYEKFLKKFFKEADSIESIIKLRPDWREDVLLNKYKELHNSDDFQIGKIPEEFSRKDLDSLTEYFKKFSQVGIKEARSIPPLKLGDKTCTFKFFTEGKTDKNVFGVFMDDKSYIMKIADSSKSSLNKPYSIGSLALIDNYLTLNKCRNTAPVRYYNHKNNIAIYDYIKGETPMTKINSLTELNNSMPDFKQLGMYYEDTLGANNYFLLDSTKLKSSGLISENKSGKEFISVDNDHVTYSKSLMPMVYDFNKALPSEMNNSF